MKQLITLLLLLWFGVSCSKPSEQRGEVSQETPELKALSVEHVPMPDASWLDPPFLAADFNGDAYLDTVRTIIRDNKKGLLIQHGNTAEEFVLGAGTPFGYGGDDFSWVEFWEIVTDTVTYEVIFDEQQEISGAVPVVLEHPAFYIGREEEGGAVIAWKEGRYQWIHQAD